MASIVLLLFNWSKGERTSLKGVRLRSCFAATVLIGLTFVLTMIFSTVAQSSSRVLEKRTITPESVKAAYLYKFSKFIRWPNSAFLDATDPIKICILNDQALYRAIQSFDFPAVNGRAIKSSLIRRLPSRERCSIVYVKDTAAPIVQHTLVALRARPTLVVSGRCDGGAGASMICFRIDKRRLSIEINHTNITCAGIHVSAQLMEFAGRTYRTTSWCRRPQASLTTVLNTLSKYEFYP